MTGPLKVALAPFAAGADIDKICRDAATLSAELVVFPEMYSNGYAPYLADMPGAREAWIAGAVDPDGPFVDRFRQAAREHGLSIVATFLERGDEKPFNSAVLIDRGGDIVLRQRKRHICSFEVPEDACAPGIGSSVVSLDTRCGPVKVGVMICMDREFPDVTLDLARQGAELILVPNSCPLVNDEQVGDVRVAGTRSRAFESVLAIAVANYPEPKDDGHSFAVDPRGTVIAMGGTGTELVIADFDLSQIRRLQEQEWFRRPAS